MVRYFCLALGVFHLFSFSLSQQAHANTAANFCIGVENSNDLVKCLSNYYDQAKDDLSQSFKTKLQKTEGQSANDLRDAQKAWIAYRDAECDWESNNAETESLRRVKELYCLARLTEERSRILDISLAEISQQQIHHGITPRWENVLSQEYSDVFWRKAEHVKSDINCDGQPENTIIGVRLNEENASKFVIGFVQAASTGRPKATIYDLPLTEDKDGATVYCGRSIKISYTPSIQDQNCTQSSVEIENGQCASHSITWENDMFKIGENVPVLTTETVQ